MNALTERIRDMWTRRAERKPWNEAQTIAELGSLTARWLTGEMASHPGYRGPVATDEEDAPGLTRALVQLCQTGIVTFSSRAGFVDTQSTQLACVTALIDQDDWRLVDELGTAMHAQGFKVLTFRGAMRAGWFRRPRSGTSVTVGWRNDRPFWDPIERLGQLNGADIFTQYEWCNGDLIERLEGAWQVNVYDPVSGRNKLWQALESWVALESTDGEVRS